MLEKRISLLRSKKHLMCFVFTIFPVLISMPAQAEKVAGAGNWETIYEIVYPDGTLGGTLRQRFPTEGQCLNTRNRIVAEAQASFEGIDQQYGPSDPEWKAMEAKANLSPCRHIATGEVSAGNIPGGFGGAAFDSGVNCVDMTRADTCGSGSQAGGGGYFDPDELQRKLDQIATMDDVNTQMDVLAESLAQTYGLSPAAAADLRMRIAQLANIESVDTQIDILGKALVDNYGVSPEAVPQIARSISKLVSIFQDNPSPIEQLTPQQKEAVIQREIRVSESESAVQTNESKRTDSGFFGQLLEATNSANFTPGVGTGSSSPTLVDPGEKWDYCQKLFEYRDDRQTGLYAKWVRSHAALRKRHPVDIEADIRFLKEINKQHKKNISREVLGVSWNLSTQRAALLATIGVVFKSTLDQVTSWLAKKFPKAEAWLELEKVVFEEATTCLIDSNESFDQAVNCISSNMQGEWALETIKRRYVKPEFDRMVKFIEMSAELWEVYDSHSDLAEAVEDQNRRIDAAFERYAAELMMAQSIQNEADAAFQTVRAINKHCDDVPVLASPDLKATGRTSEDGFSNAAVGEGNSSQLPAGSSDWYVYSYQIKDLDPSSPNYQQVSTLQSSYVQLSQCNKSRSLLSDKLYRQIDQSNAWLNDSRNVIGYTKEDARIEIAEAQFTLMNTTECSLRNLR